MRATALRLRRPRSPERPIARRRHRGQVLVKTSDVRGAGTDADVFLTAYGPKGDTGERDLAASGNNFERNQVRARCRTIAVETHLDTKKILAG